MSTPESPFLTFLSHYAKIFHETKLVLSQSDAFNQWSPQSKEEVGLIQ